MTGRRAPAGRDEAASALGDYLPALGMRDAARLIDRIAQLLDDGEAPGSVMARTNGPARLPTDAGVPPQLIEPAPSRSTVAAFGRLLEPSPDARTRELVDTAVAGAIAHDAAKPKRAKTWRIEMVEGVEVRIDQCRKCSDEFATPRRTKPGRYPERCTACRPETTR